MDSKEWADSVKADMAVIAAFAKILGESYAKEFKRLGEAIRGIEVMPGR
jgi:hypothetical protein